WIYSSIISAIVASLSLSFFFAIIFLKVITGSENSGSNNLSWFLWIIPIVFIYKVITAYIWKSNYYFEFEPEYILLRTGIWSRQENHLPYKSIQNITNSQSFFDRMLGLSTVTIQNAAQQVVAAGRGQTVMQGSGIALVWQPKEKAEELNNILNDIVNKI